MLINELSNFTKENAGLISLLTFALGLLIGNKQALGRDRRKEFNQVTEEAYLAVAKQIKAVQQGHPSVTSLGDLTLAEAYFSIFQRRAFIACVNQYNQAQHCHHPYDPTTGFAELDQTKLPQLLAASKQLIKFLKRR